MGRIVISESVTLDGVVADPNGEEGFERGGWFPAPGSRDRDAWAELELDAAMAAEALLLGRRSDEFFATRWMGRSGEWADRLNSLPKFVVSAAGRKPKWSNATLITGDVIGQVSRLRGELAGDIVVYASGRLVRTLIDHDLVDELRLVVHPVIVGAGERLFGPTRHRRHMRHVSTATVGDGLARLVYQRDEPASYNGRDD